MNIIATTALTMSSREIADLCGKEHKNVLADIRKMLGELGKAAADFSATAQIPGPNNSTRTIEVFNLPKRETLILVSGYNLAMRARIIDRWQELETQAVFNIPQTLPEALRLAADLAEHNAELQAKIDADKPKVEFAEAIRNLDGSCLVREFAKVLGTGQNRLFKWLRDNGYLMANNQPYQEYIDRKWFAVVEGTPFTDSKGVAHPTFTTRITGKGQVGIEKKWRDAHAKAAPAARPMVPAPHTVQ